MTTIVVTKNKMVSDGQVSSGDRIDAQNFKKIRKINGCLVGGAGRLSSVLNFFEWFEGFTNSSILQSTAPEVDIIVPENTTDEDFTGLVMFPDGEVLLYEGGKRCYPIFNKEYYAIGSGADYALAALDAGASAEFAVDVAKMRDVFSGGDTFVEELTEEDFADIPSREEASKLTKEELLNLIYPEEEGKEIAVEGETEMQHSEAVQFISEKLGETLKEWEDAEMSREDWKEAASVLGVKYNNKVSTKTLISLVFKRVKEIQ